MQKKTLAKRGDFSIDVAVDSVNEKAEILFTVPLKQLKTDRLLNYDITQILSMLDSFFYDEEYSNFKYAEHHPIPGIVEDPKDTFLKTTSKYFCEKENK